MNKSNQKIETTKMTVDEAIKKLESFSNENAKIPFNLVFPTLQEYLKMLAQVVGINADELFTKWMNYRNSVIK